MQWPLFLLPSYFTLYGQARGPDGTPTAGHGGRVSQLDHSHVVIGGVAHGTNSSRLLIGQKCLSSDRSSGRMLKSGCRMTSEMSALTSCGSTAVTSWGILRLHGGNKMSHIVATGHPQCRDGKVSQPREETMVGGRGGNVTINNHDFTSY